MKKFAIVENIGLVLENLSNVSIEDPLLRRGFVCNVLIKMRGRATFALVVTVSNKSLTLEPLRKRVHLVLTAVTINEMKKEFHKDKPQI